jgi:hypothetical protein
MNYFENMIKNFRTNKSYDYIQENMINVFSPYFLCDHFIADEAWHWGVLHKLPQGKNDINSSNNLDIIKDYDIVQCQWKFFSYFIQNILPKINKKIVLLTSDFQLIGPSRNEQTDFILNHPNIVLWISTNPIYEPSEKYMAFPCGFSPFNLSIYVDILLDKEIIKENELTHMHLSPTNLCRELLPKGEKFSEKDYYNNILKSKFMISPIGDRDDCYRHYECIGLKTIPISNIENCCKEIFGDNMHYCNITDMVKYIETGVIDCEYKEPNQDLITYDYYKDIIYNRIQYLRNKWVSESHH